ncbi:MAG TPA: histidine phosphatase family protein [Steroidobacteraceae bacterium]
MSRIYLVRHGQATFGADDYDQLTETGVAQCAQLARHWHAIGRRVDRVYAGTLRRQRASAEAFVRALAGEGGSALPVQALPGIEEYDHRALLCSLDDGRPLPEPPDPREFYRRLSRALDAWIDGELAGVEDYAHFRERCAAALARLLVETGRGTDAVVFGSAGSLAAAMQPALGTPDRALMRLKLTFYNSGVSCLLFDGETLTIESLNAVSHLEQPAFAHLITHR